MLSIDTVLNLVRILSVIRLSLVSVVGYDSGSSIWCYVVRGAVLSDCVVLRRVVLCVCKIV